MRLLDSASGWGTLPGSLRSQLLPWRLSSGGFTGSLFGTGHGAVAKYKYVEKNHILLPRSYLEIARSACRGSKRSTWPAIRPSTHPPLRLNQSVGFVIIRCIIIISKPYLEPQTEKPG